MKKYVKDFIFSFLGALLCWVVYLWYPDCPTWFKTAFAFCMYGSISFSIGLGLSFIFDRILVLFKCRFKVASSDQEVAE